MSPVSPLAGRFFTTEPAEKPQNGMKVKMLVAQSIQLFATLWTIAHQAPLSIEFSRQEFWSELPFPSPGDLPNPGIEPGSPTLQADSLLSEPPGKPQVGKSNFKWDGCDPAQTLLE